SRSIFLRALTAKRAACFVTNWSGPTIKFAPEALGRCIVRPAGGPMAELQFDDAAAAGYDRLIGPVSRHFIPPLMRAARIGLGMRVLDVATGTGLAAEAALAAVGLSMVSNEDKYTNTRACARGGRSVKSGSFSALALWVATTHRSS